MSPFVFVIFGGTGDLTKNKLIPALLNLFKAGLLSSGFSVVAVGRKEHSHASYKDLLHACLFGENDSDEAWPLFCERLYYYNLNFSIDKEGYKNLKAYLDRLDNQYQTLGNRIFYLAVEPGLFEAVVRNLKTNNMIENKACWQRVMLEKPFGTSLNDAIALNKNLLSHIDEDRIFRVDHYLGKEMIQDIIAIRFCNLVFETLWNRHYIDNIQITLSEQSGVESRGAYYENAGILRDMVQNHILQMLALICMEAPASLDAAHIRQEKIKALQSLRLFDEGSDCKDIVLGQYGSGYIGAQKVPGYRDEQKVHKDSQVATFIALKAFVDNERWKDVPFYIRSGKRLDNKASHIVIQFKNNACTKAYDEFKNIEPNCLVIKIQPEEGILYQINSKIPGQNFLIEKIKLDYCQSCQADYNSPEAYERIILDAAADNHALFASWEELVHSWVYTESIEKANACFCEFPNYEAGSSGPKEAKEMIRRDGRAWWES